mmetsp:Transcript_7252/g.14320  ORF Transcript_7252/g.14320 Transcript_7252/m.14320 type:complete len:280 (-) Transcript_7252:277-1116(-)
MLESLSPTVSKVAPRLELLLAFTHSFNAIVKRTVVQCSHAALVIAHQQVPDRHDLTRHEILASAAHTALLMEAWQDALSYGRSLALDPKSKPWESGFVGVSYAAEAFVRLNQPKTASTCLAAWVAKAELEAVGMEEAAAQRAMHKSGVTDLLCDESDLLIESYKHQQSVLGLLNTNLAAVLASMGDIQGALQALVKVSKAAHQVQCCSSSSTAGEKKGGGRSNAFVSLTNANRFKSRLTQNANSLSLVRPGFRSVVGDADWLDSATKVALFCRIHSSRR